MSAGARLALVVAAAAVAVIACCQVAPEGVQAQLLLAPEPAASLASYYDLLPSEAVFAERDPFVAGGEGAGGRSWLDLIDMNDDDDNRLATPLGLANNRNHNDDYVDKWDSLQDLLLGTSQSAPQQQQQQLEMFPQLAEVDLEQSADEQGAPPPPADQLLEPPANNLLDFELAELDITGPKGRTANASQRAQPAASQQTTPTTSTSPTTTNPSEPQQQQSQTTRALSPPEQRSQGGEYIDHPLVLLGHQLVQGGAGEGRQLLGPDGTFENVQVVKSDHAVPSYCDPPNPCPIGYTAEDGCLEQFVNSASFSREYQSKQQCQCDNEHSLFNCAAPDTSSDASSSTSSTSSSSRPTGGREDYEEGGQEEEEEEGGGGGGHRAGKNHLNSLERLSAVVMDPLAHPYDHQAPSSAPGVDLLGSAANEPGTGDGDGERPASVRLDTLARALHNRYGELDSVRNLIRSKQQSDADERPF